MDAESTRTSSEPAKPSCHHCEHHNEAPSGKRPEGDPKAIYICPMHPEIRQQGPGACPKCGRALEALIAGDDDDTSEYRDMLRRFWLAAGFTAPLFIVSMGDMLPGRPFSTTLSSSGRGWLELALARFRPRIPLEAGFVDGIYPEGA